MRFGPVGAVSPEQAWKQAARGRKHQSAAGARAGRMGGATGGSRRGAPAGRNGGATRAPATPRPNDRHRHRLRLATISTLRGASLTPAGRVGQSIGTFGRDGPSMTTTPARTRDVAVGARAGAESTETWGFALLWASRSSASGFALVGIGVRLFALPHFCQLGFDVFWYSLALAFGACLARLALLIHCGSAENIETY